MPRLHRKLILCRNLFRENKGRWVIATWPNLIATCIAARGRQRCSGAGDFVLKAVMVI